RLPRHLLAAVLVLAGPPVLLAADERSEKEVLPPGMKVMKLEARPSALALKTPYDYAQVLLTGVLEGGEKIDVTRVAKVEAPLKVVSVAPTGLVRPTGDGTGDLKFTVAGQSLSIPVVVTGQQ